MGIHSAIVHSGFKMSPLIFVLVCFVCVQGESPPIEPEPNCLHVPADCGCDEKTGEIDCSGYAIVEPEPIFALEPCPKMCQCLHNKMGQIISKACVSVNPPMVVEKPTLLLPCLVKDCAQCKKGKRDR